MGQCNDIWVCSMVRCNLFCGTCYLLPCYDGTLSRHSGLLRKKAVIQLARRPAFKQNEAGLTGISIFNRLCGAIAQ